MFKTPLVDCAHWDCRIGGAPQLVLSPERSVEMQIPDAIRKCVAFAAYKTADGYRNCGTIFFVGIDLVLGRSATYAITARHVIEKIQDSPSCVDRDSMYIRVNLLDGSCEYAAIQFDKWRFPDNGADLAIASIMIGQPTLDVQMLPLAMLATQSVIDKQGITLGDEVFLTGLFSKRSGQKRNFPIVRVGNIAAMLDEPIKWTTIGGTELFMDAFLVEARSIGGISGSPVFVHLGFVRSVPVGVIPTGSGFHLLGLMHGHWDMPTADEDENSADFLGEKINTGIAIVVPAQSIYDFLFSPVFVEERNAAKAALENQDLTTPD